jgi:multidrug transporter EmrE-like cation transporter
LRPQDLARLVALGAMWGLSYLFMRVAVPHLGAPLMIELRVLIGGVLLAIALAAGGGPGRPAQTLARMALSTAFVGTAMPFVLIAAAVRTIDASTASILNALVPLFATVVAAVWIRERITPPKAAGIVLSLAGTGGAGRMDADADEHGRARRRLHVGARHVPLRDQHRVQQGAPARRAADRDLRGVAALRRDRPRATRAARAARS